MDLGFEILRYLNLLCHGKPKFNVYKSLGLCYAGLGEYKKALDYFTVAEGLALLGIKCPDKM